MVRLQCGHREAAHSLDLRSPTSEVDDADSETAQKADPNEVTIPTAVTTRTAGHPGFGFGWHASPVEGLPGLQL